MKYRTANMITIGLVLIFTLSFSNLVAQTKQKKLKSTGIGFRLSYWNMSDEPTHVTVSDYGENTAVNIGGAGAWLYFFSRINYNAFIEFSIGGIAKVREEQHSYSSTDVEVTAITPILLGFRLDLFSPQSQSALQPYVCFGAGPYWLSNIDVKERLYEDEVTVNTKFKRGGYAGGGFNFILSSWLAVNFDVKYHFIDFNIHQENSGYEFGMGLNFMWGSYRLP